MAAHSPIAMHEKLYEVPTLSILAERGGGAGIGKPEYAQQPKDIAKFFHGIGQNLPTPPALWKFEIPTAPGATRGPMAAFEDDAPSTSPPAQPDMKPTVPNLAHPNAISAGGNDRQRMMGRMLNNSMG